MSLLSPERIQEAAPQVRTFQRKVALVETERWITDNLPSGSGLPPATVLARQLVALQEDLRRYLAAQEERFVERVRTHPPELRPIDSGALAALPPEAVLTYHVWVQDIIQATQDADKKELAALLAEHLREAIGTGGEAARRQVGALAPGYGRLAQKEARELLRRTGASVDIGAQAFRRALEDRAKNKAVQGAALRDGAGRVIAAATFTTRGEALDVRYLGALETVVPGAGVHMLRELAGLAAESNKPIALVAPAESVTVLLEMGFTQGAGGRFLASADSALALAQSAPGPSPAWTRAGWLEGSEAVFEAKPGMDLQDALRQASQWSVVRKALAPLGAESPGFGIATLSAKDGTLLAVAQYQLPERAGDLIVRHLWLKPGAPPTTGRQIMRKLAGLAAQAGRGVRFAATTSASVGLAARLGMAEVAEVYAFTAGQTAAFSGGLTRGTTFVGTISWELAVAGAREYLENIIIPGVVDTVSATTHRQLVDALIEGLARGEGTNDLIARIRAIDDTAFGLVRAERIARTEAISANRAGAHQIAVAAGATTKKWVSRLKRNTRDWHRAAHGQVRPIAEPFEVANRKGVLEYLMFPGDRSLGASAENVIQCCCASLTEKPGVSDPATYDEYGAADTDNSVVPLVVYMPEPVRKAGAFTLDDLRTIVAKDKGWAPGPNAGWRRLDEETQTNEPEPGVPERSNDDGQRTDEAQLADLEADANARLKQWEAERAASTNRYKNKAPKELNDLHANFDSQVARLRENKRSAELNNTGWGAGDEEALQMKIERLNDIRAEVASRRQYYGIQRQIKAIEMSRERGVPVLERSQVESLLGNVGDAYADAGVRGRGYTPEAFHVSHLSGRPVRWYVTLPDGRIAHPDEIHEARQRGRLAVIDNIVPDDRDWTQD